ncbi:MULTISPECIES: ArsO family NAD(P)H-dependent flavin-containing monooxygenase [Kitasatospora]|uniref:Putative flavin-binding monooxygenase n=1 Tax=Kitasatospora setae (strain ATCC 33774 / DSM 43861 / JCM 3304 / KCC A-0304 / NBRC 14216 / KM-6054) TaxID=452652 RepID=E4N760_KITSK|nr:ArsO family NAD(P)H-dependent flavin-containing monooxygenase [Kitasatospora setae]BAJ27041.1 putative flavin-binding monooxygenase [Kitasatospora setae KM-6054]
MTGRRTEVLVVGGGQAGLAAGYYLRRAGLDFRILDAAPAPGGAWRHHWDTLRLFSPAAHSSLPGRPMPRQPGHDQPDAAHTAAYLAEYEQRYELPVLRPVRVERVERVEHVERPDGGGLLSARTDSGDWHARALIMATGSRRRPFVPAVPGLRDFTGRQLHSRDYRSAADFAGQRVLVVGGGNSGAQIAADLTGTAAVRWVTRRPPRFLPDEVDGRALFDLASRHVRGDGPRLGDLGDLVAVPPVRAARDAGRLTAHPMFHRLDAGGAVWEDDERWPCDAIVWCTGFRPDLGPLRGLGLRDRTGRVPTDGTRVLADPRIHLLGYGDWTGPASATLTGVGRTARTAVDQLAATLRRTA